MGTDGEDSVGAVERDDEDIVTNGTNRARHGSESDDQPRAISLRDWLRSLQAELKPSALPCYPFLGHNTHGFCVVRDLRTLFQALWLPFPQSDLPTPFTIHTIGYSMSLISTHCQRQSQFV